MVESVKDKRSWMEERECEMEIELGGVVKEKRNGRKSRIGNE